LSSGRCNHLSFIQSPTLKNWVQIVGVVILIHYGIIPPVRPIIWIQLHKLNSLEVLSKILENNGIIQLFEIHIIIWLFIFFFFTIRLVFKIIYWNFIKIFRVLNCLFCFIGVVKGKAFGYSKEILQERLFVFSNLIFLPLFLRLWWNTILFFYYILFREKLWSSYPFRRLSFHCHSTNFKWLLTCGQRYAQPFFTHVFFRRLIPRFFLIWAYCLRQAQISWRFWNIGWMFLR